MPELRFACSRPTSFRNIMNRPLSNQPDTEKLNAEQASLMVDSLIALGIDHFFLAPGSRCTPLTLAIAKHVDQSKATVTQHFDERGLAYCCLGHGRATRQCGVFVCTSGTAAANAFPAVIEAAADHVPMLLLTADRPPELRDTGANQTIDQVKMYGHAVRWFFDLATPSDALSWRHVASTIRHAVEQSQDGPVHVNCMYREPLGVSSEVARDQDGTQLHQTTVVHSAEYHVKIPGGNTLVLVGGCGPNEANAARLMAKRLGCPCLGDIASGVRQLAYPFVDQLDSGYLPEAVVHVGGRITSKPLLQFLDRSPIQDWVHISPFGSRIDPLHRITAHVAGPVEPICERLTFERSSDVQFLKKWSLASDCWMAASQEVLDQRDTVTEPAIARMIASELPSDHGLFLGNSTPVRDFDKFAYWEDSRGICVGTNRGASGIDGILATAIGYASGLGRKATVVLGDLSLLHDLNSLALLRKARCPVTIVAINNDGGGIFSQLPIANNEQHFETYFRTPHGIEFEHAANCFGVDYCRPGSMNDFRLAYRSALSRNQSALIEVKTRVDENLEANRAVADEFQRMRV